MEANLSDHEQGKYGAKRTSFRPNNPREMVRRIWAKDPAAGESVWRQQFWDALQKNNDARRTVVDYFFDNAIRALLMEDPDRKTRRQDASARAENSAKQALREHINKEAQIILFDLLMPNGKRLGNCTGTECKSFGGWLSALGELAGKKRISSVMSEGEARKIWLDHTI